MRVAGVCANECLSKSYICLGVVTDEVQQTPRVRSSEKSLECAVPSDDAQDGAPIIAECLVVLLKWRRSLLEWRASYIFLLLHAVGVSQQRRRRATDQHDSLTGAGGKTAFVVPGNACGSPRSTAERFLIGILPYIGILPPSRRGGGLLMVPL